MTATSHDERAIQPLEDAGALAELHGLRRIGIRPPLAEYVRDIWRRREFATVLATSSAYAENQNTYLGQAWRVLKPALDALVYVLIFGLLLGTSRGLDNFIGFIVVGTFMYRFFNGSVTSAAKSVVNSTNLVRSLRFPRAHLPISAVLSELASLIPTTAVMLCFVLLSGLIPGNTPVYPSWRWLMLPFAILLIFVFSLGVGFFLARLAAGFRDLLNFLPFMLRVLMYGSGVIFSIDHYVHRPGIAGIMQYQPVAVLLNLARQSVLDEPSIPFRWDLWLIGLGWAVLAVVGGFVFFWRDEARYGRE